MQKSKHGISFYVQELHAGFKSVYNEQRSSRESVCVWGLIKEKERTKDGYVGVNMAAKQERWSQWCDREVMQRGCWGWTWSGWVVVLRGASWRQRLLKVWYSCSSLPPAPAGGAGGVAASSVSAAGLVPAQFRLRLLATVAAVIVAMVLLIERYRSRHVAGRCCCTSPEWSAFLAACLLSAWLVSVQEQVDRYRISLSGWLHKLAVLWFISTWCL